jgi:hypothetical protein
VCSFETIPKVLAPGALQNDLAAVPAAPSCWPVKIRGGCYSEIAALFAGNQAHTLAAPDPFAIDTDPDVVNHLEISKAVAHNVRQWLRWLWRAFSFC